MPRAHATPPGLLCYVDGCGLPASHVPVPYPQRSHPRQARTALRAAAAVQSMRQSGRGTARQL